MSTEKKVTVYDLDNKPHRMTHLNARDMMQHNGWTLQPVDRAAMKKAQEAAVEDDAESERDPVSTSLLEKELNGKSKGEMIAIAAERYGIKIDGRKGEAEVITIILDAASKVDSESESNDDDDADGDEADDGINDNE